MVLIFFLYETVLNEYEIDSGESFCEEGEYVIVIENGIPIENDIAIENYIVIGNGNGSDTENIVIGNDIDITNNSGIEKHSINRAVLSEDSETFIGRKKHDHEYFGRDSHLKSPYHLHFRWRMPGRSRSTMCIVSRTLQKMVGRNFSRNLIATTLYRTVRR